MGVGVGTILVAVGVGLGALVGVSVAATGIDSGGHDGCTTTAIMAKALMTITASSIFWATSSAYLLIKRLSPPGGARLPISKICSIIPLISNLVNFTYAHHLSPPCLDGLALHEFTLPICGYEAFVLESFVFAMEATGVMSTLHHRRT